MIATDPALRATVASMTRAPWQAVEASTGGEALAAIARGERFAAIVCDAQLPDFGGLALREAIEAIAPSQADRMTLMSPVMLGWDLRLLARRGSLRVIARPFTEAVFRSVFQPPERRRRSPRRK